MKLFPTVGFSLFGILAIVTFAQSAQAQVKITGGSGTINDAKIFVPTDAKGSGDTRTNVYEGKFNNVRINTEVGKLPANLIFKPSFVPTFNNPVGTAPEVGTTGSVLGSTSFKTLTNDGRPAYFVNIPTKLDFALTSLPCFQCGKPTNEYGGATRPLTERGYVLTPFSFKTVERTTPGFPIQYLKPGDSPESITVGKPFLNADEKIPASDFTLRREGLTFKGDVKFDIKGGIFGDGYVTSQQLGEALKADTSPAPVSGGGTYTPGRVYTSSIFVSVIKISTTQYTYVNNSKPITINVWRNPVTSGETGGTKTNPETTVNSPKGWYFYSQTTYFNVSLNKNVYVIVGSRPTDNKKVDDKKVDDKKVDDKKVDDKKVDDKKVDDKKVDDKKVDDKKVDDDEIKIDPNKIAYYDPTNGKTYVPVGVASRVFPDMIGLDEVKLDK